MKTAQAAILSATLMLSGGAHAALLKNLEFNVDGVLPSAEPDVEFFTNSGLAESTLYSVAGGFLHQQTFSTNGNSSYQHPVVLVLGGALDPSLNLTMEARVSIGSINGSGGAYFQAFDGVNRYSALFESSGVTLQTTTGSQFVAVDVGSFHTYRLESAGNSDILRLFIDGSLEATVTAATENTLNGFGFGDGITAVGNGADAQWDYIRVSQVPLPAAAWLFGSALLGLGALGQKRA